MLIRPVQPTDRAEWLRMRLNLWGGTAEEHTQDIDAYFSTPQDGVTFVVERHRRRTLRIYRGQSPELRGRLHRRPQSPISKGGTLIGEPSSRNWAPVLCKPQRHGRGVMGSRKLPVIRRSTIR